MLTSDMRRKKPIEVPRPGDNSRDRQDQPAITGSPETGLQAHGMAGMIAAAQVYGAAVSTHE